MEKLNRGISSEQRVADNKAVALALGWEVKTSNDGRVKIRKTPKGLLHNANNLYLDDWLPLMKVVQEIESIGDYGVHGKFIVHISGTSCSIQGSNLEHYIHHKDAYTIPVFCNDIDSGHKLTSVYDAVIDFCCWYVEERRAKIETSTNYVDTSVEQYISQPAISTTDFGYYHAISAYV